MRTRSHGAASPPSSPPPAKAQQPRGRKRSIASRDGQEIGPYEDPSPRPDEIVIDHTPNDENNRYRSLLTPRKTKRVRFSEPIERLERRDPGITGLTPIMRKTKLSTAIHGAPRRSSHQRRVTLPARLESNPPVMATPQQVQFEPLRQVLDNRMRRRLRRSHLSEEINDIDAAKREEERYERELETLRASGQQSNEKIKDLMFELESQRQLGIQLGTEEEAHAHALQEELGQLRRELLDRDAAEEERRRIEGTPTEFDEDENLWDDQFEPPSPLMANVQTSSSSPIAGDKFANSPLPPSSPPVNAAVQTSLTEQSQYFIDGFSTEADHRAAEAQATLQMIHNELLALGFKEGQSSSKEVIQSIRDAFRQTRLELEHMLPGETPGGFENVLLLPAMLDHIHKLLRKIHEKQKTIEIQFQSESALRGQFNATLEKLAHLENEKTIFIAQKEDAIAEAKRKDRFVHDLQLASEARAGIVSERDVVINKLEEELKSTRKMLEERTNRVSQLENENREHAISVERLQNALQSYRSEVTSLEKLVGTLERDKDQIQTAVSQYSNATNNGEVQARQALEDVARYIHGHLERAKSATRTQLAEQNQICEETRAFLNGKLAAVNSNAE